MISQESVRGIEKKYHKNFISYFKHVWGVKYRVQPKGRRETPTRGKIQTEEYRGVKHRQQTRGKIPTADQG